jgi:hypothetical protein
MSGVSNSLLGTAKTFPSSIVTELAKVQSKTAGTTISSGAVSMTAGRTYWVLLAFDPSGNQLPTGTVSDTANTYGEYTFFLAPATTSAGTGVIVNTFITKAGATASRTITATLSASVTAKTMIVLEMTNTQNTGGGAQGAQGTTSTLSYNSAPALSAGDVLFTYTGWESPNAVVSGSTSTTSGTWSAISQINTIGGTANTNIGIAYQYKILTAPMTGITEAINWTLGTTPNNWASTTLGLFHYMNS